MPGRPRQKKTLVVFCEGEKTEPQYRRALKRLPDVRDVAAVDLRVEIGHGGAAAETLVSRAIAARDKDREGGQAEIDEFWCVFDVEWPVNTPGLTTAVKQAEEKGQLDGATGKSLDPSKYMPFSAIAAQRAASLDRRHLMDGIVIPQNNPSSGSTF
jgi:hypothetical protein